MLHIRTFFPDGTIAEGKYENLSPTLEEMFVDFCPMWDSVAYARKVKLTGRVYDQLPREDMLCDCKQKEAERLASILECTQCKSAKERGEACRCGRGPQAWCGELCKGRM